MVGVKQFNHSRRLFHSIHVPSCDPAIECSHAVTDERQLRQHCTDTPTAAAEIIKRSTGLL